MRQLAKRLLIAMMLVTLGACSATSLKGTWTNPGYRETGIRKVLVLADSENETYRRIFEDALSRELNRQGVAAEPGYALYPDQPRPARGTIASELAAKGFDALVVSRETGRRTKERLIPGAPYYPYGPPQYYRQWYDYYSWDYAPLYGPAYVETYEIVTVQSNLHATKSEEIIWSATSETVIDNGELEGLINSLVTALIDGLIEAGLL